MLEVDQVGREKQLGRMRVGIPFLQLERAASAADPLQAIPGLFDNDLLANKDGEEGAAVEEEGSVIGSKQ